MPDTVPKTRPRVQTIRVLTYGTQETRRCRWSGCPGAIIAARADTPFDGGAVVAATPEGTFVLHVRDRELVLARTTAPAAAIAAVLVLLADARARVAAIASDRVMIARRRSFGSPTNLAVNSSVNATCTTGC